MYKNLVVAGLATAVLVCGNVKADETTAAAKFQDAQALFAKREVMKNNLEARALLQNEVLPATQDVELKYRASVLLARTFYYEGLVLQETSKHPAMAAYQNAMDVAAAAYEDVSDKYSDAYYYYAISLGRWALLKGKLSVLGRKQELINHCNWAIERVTQAGAPGEEIDGFGPHRTLGRMYAELPGFAGGDMAAARRHLERAFVNAPGHVINHAYYAEALISSKRKAEGCSILDDVLMYEDMPEELDDSRVPEAGFELRDARKVYVSEKC